MSKTLSSLSWLTTVGIFLFVGILYLSVFASQQKTWAIKCSTGPDGTYRSWCAITGFQYIPVPGINDGLKASLCTDACNQCGQVPCPPPPSVPTCSSFGGNCYRRLSCAPTYVSLSGGDAYCERFGPVYSCCRPKNACERVNGTCVGASSGGVSPCPAGKHYNTSLSCSSFYQVCCAPNQAPPPPPPPPPPAATYTISGRVFVDSNRNSVKDATEAYYRSGAVTLTRSGYTTLHDTTDANGFYSFANRSRGTYTVTFSLPINFRMTPGTSSSVSVSLTGNRTVNFAMSRTYFISGNIFIDDGGTKNPDGTTRGIAENGRKDGDEINYTRGGITIGLVNDTPGGPTGTNAVNQGAGTYTTTNLFAGTYKVSYAPPAGYLMSVPINGPPPSFKVTVGPTCVINPLVNGVTGATCSASNVTNLNFALKQYDTWIQTYGFDVRLDDGYTNIIPANPAYPPYASVENTQ